MKGEKLYLKCLAFWESMPKIGKIGLIRYKFFGFLVSVQAKTTIFWYMLAFHPKVGIGGNQTA